jgi:hypothetical protein
MAIRFHRSLKLLPGVRLNFGKRGVGISAGVRGLRVGVDSRGKRYTSVGIPGTGLSARNYAKQSDPQRAQQIQGAFVMGVLIAIGIIVVLVVIGMAMQQ